MTDLLSNPCGNELCGLQFKNVGVVTKSMKFKYALKPCFYVEDLDTWSTPWGAPWDKSYRYLFRIKDEKMVDPPAGMRSAVPLGGLGAGTVELRADGSFRDWNVFNNSPADGSWPNGPKVHLDETLFGLRTKVEEAEAKIWALRTHPPPGLPPIAQIEYSGTFPLSRLRFVDPDLPLTANLYAYCEFRMRDPESSATPAAIFSFNLHNPSNKPIETSILFNLPNHIKGKYSSGKGLTLSKDGKSPTSGTMALRIAGEKMPISWLTSCDLKGVWKAFVDRGVLETSAITGKSDAHGALATRVTLVPSESRTVTFVLSWYFPFRPHAGKMLGNYYSNLYTSADDVADKVVSRLPSTWEAIHQWQHLCFENSLPDWLQDALVNSVATMYKTGMWFADGRWRQWESFSCPSVEPLCILSYRSLPYALFFPALQQDLLKGFANTQRDDGYISHDLGRWNRPLDTPAYERDSCTMFLLGIYVNYLWTGDRKFFDSIWPNAKRAADWQIRRCEKYGLPNNLENTYDWWNFEHKDLVTYNAFLHIAAMLATEKMAIIQGDEEFAAACRRNIEPARKSLYEHLWTGEYFRAWWMKEGGYPDALHVDTLYGQLWAFILGLGWTADPDKIKSHLEAEHKINGSPYGLKVMRKTGYDDADPSSPPHANNLIWEAGSLDWAALNIYIGGDLEKSLAEAAKIINKYRLKLRDQWDYRDLSTPWDGYPWCNSHYARQLIFWSIPLALSGQQYSAAEKKLLFDPKVSAPAKLPFFTPTVNGTLELLEGYRYRLTILSGELKLNKLLIAKASVAAQISLKVGQSLVVEADREETLRLSRADL